MTQLKDTNAYAIPVPVDASDIRLIKHIDSIGNCLTYNMPDKRIGYGILMDIYEGKYTLLGTATKEHISFDAESIVDKIDGTYPDYRRKDLKKFLTAEYSFHSLMQASGCYYENPFGEKPYFNTIIYGVSALAITRYKSDLFKWQQAQKNTSEKWVIIKKQD